MRGNLLLLSAVFGTSCVPYTTFELVLDRGHLGAARAPESVTVMRARPDQAYRVVALLSVEENLRVDLDERVREEKQLSLLRVRGARFGCDAIVVSRSDTVWCGRRSRCYEMYGHRADCLVFR